MKKGLKVGVTTALLIGSSVLYSQAIPMFINWDEKGDILWLVAWAMSLVGGFLLVSVCNMAQSFLVSLISVGILFLPTYFTWNAIKSAPNHEFNAFFYIIVLISWAPYSLLLAGDRSKSYNESVNNKVTDLIIEKYHSIFNRLFQSQFNQSIEKVLLTDITNFPKKKYSNEAFYSESAPLVMISERYFSIMKSLNHLKHYDTMEKTHALKRSIQNINNWPKDLKLVTPMTFYKTFHGIHIGLEGELGLFKMLDQLGIPAFRNAVCKSPTGETIEVDAIFVYNDVVYTVEAKNYEAPKIVLSSGGSFSRFDKHGIEHPMDTLSQVTRHKRILKSILGNDVPIVNVIVLTNSDTLVENNFNTKELIVAALDSLPFIFSDTFKETELTRTVFNTLSRVQTEGKQYEFPDVNLLKSDWNQFVLHAKQDALESVSLIFNLHDSLKELNERELKELITNMYFKSFEYNQKNRYIHWKRPIEELKDYCEKSKPLYLELIELLNTV